jgi:folate-dependent phosphoribosylglycinamide formyltransferase PurN
MKIIIITNGNIPSYIGLHSILKEYKSEIRKIFITTKVPGQRTKLKGLINITKKAGIKYTIFKSFYNILLPKFFMAVKIPCTVQKKAKLISIPYAETDNINTQKNIEEIKKINPDVIISFSATQKFCDDLIDTANLIVINVHFSPLPKYGGLSPYVWQLINNEKGAGVTIHKIISKLDAGPIIEQKEVKIKPRISALKLLIKQSILASEMLPEILAQIKVKKLKLTKQNLSEKTYFKHPQKSDLKKLYINGFRLMNIDDFQYISKVLKDINKKFPI